MKNTLLILLAIMLVGGTYVLLNQPSQEAVDIVYQDEVTTYVGDALFSVQYSDNKEYAKVSLSGVQHELTSTQSASGAKYQNRDGSVVFWEKGSEATLEMNGEIVTATIAPTELPPLQANGWYWKETIYNNDEVVKAVEPAQFLLTFREDGQFSATTDCNNGAGSYETKNNKLTFGPIAATKKACMGETQERVFFNILSEVESYLVTENGDLALQLKFDSGVMIFTPAR